MSRLRRVLRIRVFGRGVVEIDRLLRHAGQYGVGLAALLALARLLPLLGQPHDAHALDAARIGVEHFELEQAGAGDQFTAQRQAARARRQIAAERIDFFGDVLLDDEVLADDGDDILE
jgi:hypothetical protein